MIYAGAILFALGILLLIAVFESQHLARKRRRAEAFARVAGAIDRVTTAFAGAAETGFAIAVFQQLGRVLAEFDAAMRETRARQREGWVGAGAVTMANVTWTQFLFQVPWRRPVQSSRAHTTPGGKTAARRKRVRR